MGWNAFFNILKWAATLLSGFGAIMAAVPNDRRRKQATKSRLGRIWRVIGSKETGLYIAVIGFLVAVLSQFVENKLDRTKDEEASESTNRLLRNILRQETRFTNICVNIVSRMSCLDSTMDMLCPTRIVNHADSPSTNFPDFMRYQTSGETSGLFTNEDNSVTPIVYIWSRGRSSTGVSLGVYEGFDTNWTARGVSSFQAGEIKSLIRDAELFVNFYNDEKSEYATNFATDLFRKASITNIYYFPSDQAVQIFWSFASDAIDVSRQQVYSRYVSVSDLPTGFVRLSLINYGNRVGETNWVYKIDLDDVSMQLGDYYWQLGDPFKEAVTNFQGQEFMCSQFTFVCPFRDLRGLGY